MRKPRLISPCVADRYSGPGERRAEFGFRIYLEPADDNAPCACCNCNWKGAAGEAAKRGIADPGQRLCPGYPTPVGECPECGALAQLCEEA